MAEHIQENVVMALCGLKALVKQEEQINYKNMNTKERAFNLIAKTQQHLASHKVDLSLISDIDSAFDKAIASERGIAKQAQALELDAKSAANNYEIVINKGKNALQKAKELGADDLVRAIQSRIGDAEASKKEMESIVSKVKSFII